MRNMYHCSNTMVERPYLNKTMTVAIPTMAYANVVPLNHMIPTSTKCM